METDYLASWSPAASRRARSLRLPCEWKQEKRPYTRLLKLYRRTQENSANVSSIEQTRFVHLTYPIRRITRRGSGMSSVLEHKPERRTALVVDDEPPVRSTVKSILSEIGFHVVESENGRHALSFLQTKPCLDLLVTETRPPEVDGRTLAETFMLQCPLGRTILLSEHADTTDINIESTGAWTFIPKQRLSEVLIHAIRRIGFGHPQRVILVVDDEALVRKFVQTILVMAGYVVIEAGDGQEALELSRTYSSNIDLVVTDFEMPHLNGMQLAEHIRRERPDAQILLMSGYIEETFRESATTPHFLAKPFLPKRLTDKVAEVLNRTESNGANAEMWNAFTPGTRDQHANGSGRTTDREGTESLKESFVSVPAE